MAHSLTRFTLRDGTVVGEGVVRHTVGVDVTVVVVVAPDPGDWPNAARKTKKTTMTWMMMTAMMTIRMTAMTMSMLFFQPIIMVVEAARKVLLARREKSAYLVSTHQVFQKQGDGEFYGGI